MSISESLLNTLRQSVAANPDDIDVRLHLAQLLTQVELAAEALTHFEFILAKQPAHITALQGAAQAARASGDNGKADGYQTLYQALNPQTQPQEPGSSPAPHSDNVHTLKPGNDDKPARQPLRSVAKPDNLEIGPWEDFQAPITLADVGGMEKVKQRLNMAFLAPMKNPDLLKMYGKSLSGGLMLYGPPGCGKTYIARALAGELGARFISIGMADVLDMWLGESERKLHEIFETARRNAPCVLFFDEIDALGQKRSQLKHSAGRSIVNQLLAEMDSVGNENNNVFILAATNHPWDVDTALRRPGRFDRTVLVLPPDQPARQTILDLNLKDRPIAALDTQALAQQTRFFSGADLSHLCETAVEYALEDAINSGEARPVSQADFAKALAEIRPSTRPWFETARNYAMFANEGGTYDELLEFIREHKL